MIGELREGYIAKWKKYPTDETKIRVARPSVLAPSKHLLNAFMDIKKAFMVTGVSEIESRKIAWSSIGYKRRYIFQLLCSLEAQMKLRQIVDLLKSGHNVRLICYEKEPPCHRFILMDIIREMVE